MTLCQIDGCRSAAIVGGVKHVGGICGDLGVAGAQIINCRNDGVVRGTANVGGICGVNSGVLRGCRNGGAVMGSANSSRIGGLCGISYSEIADGYNTAAVSGRSNTGGLCGVISGMVSKYATLNGVYNPGAITGMSNCAAICGVTNAYCQLSDCYYLDTCSSVGIGYNQGAYITTGKSSAQFASGEVAYLLGAAFGQTLGAMPEPAPGFRTTVPDNTVYRLTYFNGAAIFATQYYNCGDAVTDPVTAGEIPPPTDESGYFAGWTDLPPTMPAYDIEVTALFAQLPGAPGGLTAIPGDGQVELTWSAPADNGGSAVLGYNIYREGEKVNAGLITALFYTDSGLTNGVTYSYEVAAVNAAGEGERAKLETTPAYSYQQRSLTDSDSSISVSGIIRRDSVLKAGDLKLHDKGECAACDEIRKHQNDDDYVFILAKEINLSHGFTGTLTITIEVGSRYNGQEVTILHCAGGELKTYSATASGAKSPSR